MTDAKILKLKPQLVVGMKRFDSYDVIPETLMEVHEYALNMGARVVGPPAAFFHIKTEQDLKESLMLDKNNIEVVWPIESPIKETHSIKCYELPEIKVAEFTHVGPYNKFKDSYEYLFNWLEDKKMKIVGPIMHVYLESPDRINYSDAVTSICVPVE